MIGICRSTDNHLCALSRRCKSWCMTKYLSFLFAPQHSLLDILHRSKNTFKILFRCKCPKALFIGYLNIYTKTVGIQSCFVHQILTGTRDAFQMDVTMKTMYQTEIFYHTYKSFHRVIRTAHHTRAQEKPFNIVTPIKLNRQFHQFGNRKCSARNIITAAVNAISTVIHTIVGQHYFQKRDTPSVLSKTMADTPSGSTPQFSFLTGTGRTTGGARHIVFSRFRQYFQLFQHTFFHSTFFISDTKKMNFQAIFKW